MLKQLLLILVMCGLMSGCGASDPQLKEVMTQKTLWQQRIDQQLRFDNRYDVFLLWLSNEYGVEPLSFDKTPTYLLLETIPSDIEANREYYILLKMELTDDQRIGSTSTSVTKTASLRAKG